MADEIPPVNPEAKGPKLVEVRVPEPLEPSEKEVFEGRIMELKEENAALKSRIEELEKPKPEPKKKSVASRFCPL